MGRHWFAVVVLLFTTKSFAFNYSILQGSTSDKVTHFTVVAPAADRLGFRVRASRSPSLIASLAAERVSYPGSDWVVFRMKAEGLKPNVEYQLEVIDERGQLVERRTFNSIDLNKTGGRIAVGSCMIRQLHNPFLWNNLEKSENRPDVLMITGDAAYLDRANLLTARPPSTGLEAWEEFIKARLKVNLYYWQHLVPVLSVWDDHDSGGDNDDMSWALMPEIKKIYETFFANEEIPGFLERGPGMAKQFRLFGKNFIFLDGRSFRNGSPLAPLFGVEQDLWLLQKVQPGSNFIISGTQFYGGPIQKDSLEYNWPEFAREWTKNLRHAGEQKNATFAFVSGDVHFSEVQDLEPALFGYWTVEITSSNIHSFGLPGHYFLKPHNPRRREVTGTHNIVLMEFAAEVRDFNFQVRSLGWRGQDLFKTMISISGPAQKLLALASCEQLLATPQVEALKP